MRQLTVFEADDGTRFDDQAQAAERDLEVKVEKMVTSVFLGAIQITNGRELSTFILKRQCDLRTVLDTLPCLKTPTFKELADSLGHKSDLALVASFGPKGKSKIKTDPFTLDPKPPKTRVREVYDALVEMGGTGTRRDVMIKIGCPPSAELRALVDQKIVKLVSRGLYKVVSKKGPRFVSTHPRAMGLPPNEMRILQFFAKHPKKQFTVLEMDKRMGKPMGGILSDLTTLGKLKHPKPSTYQFDSK